MINLENEDVRAFLAVCEHDSVDEAAHALGIKQCTVRINVSRLELALKSRLVHIYGRGRVELTSVGRVMRIVYERQHTRQQFNHVEGLSTVH